MFLAALSLVKAHLAKSFLIFMIALMTAQLVLFIPHVLGSSDHNYSSPCPAILDIPGNSVYDDSSPCSILFDFLETVSIKTAHLVLTSSTVPGSRVLNESLPCQVLSDVYGSSVYDYSLMFLAPLFMMKSHLVLSIPDVPGTSFYYYRSPCLSVPDVYGSSIHVDRSPCSVHSRCFVQQCP
jgi:hypothetical protein